MLPSRPVDFADLCSDEKFVGEMNEIELFLDGDV